MCVVNDLEGTVWYTWMREGKKLCRAARKVVFTLKCVYMCWVNSTQVHDGDVINMKIWILSV